MSSRPDPFDLRDLGRLLDQDDEEYDILSRPSGSRLSSSRPTSSRPSSSRSAAVPSTSAPPLGGSRLSLNSRPPRSGGEFFPAAASRLPRSIGGGSGVYSEPQLASPRGSETPMPVIFISDHEVASTCRGTYAATSRFCIKKIIPGGQHHCGIPSHKKNKYQVKGGTFWAPGGYVKNELVALCGECVEKDAIPSSMLHLFDKDARRSSAEWRNIIIDAMIPEPSLELRSVASRSKGGSRDDIEEEGEENVEVEIPEDGFEEISLLGSIGITKQDMEFEEWLTVENQEESAQWPKHVLQHQAAMDVLFAKVKVLGATVGKLAVKLDEDVIPIVNVTSYDVRDVQRNQGVMQESIDHLSAIIKVLEQRHADGEAMRKSWDGCVSGLADINLDMADLRREVDEQATAAKATEGVIAGLIMRVQKSVTSKTSTLADPVSALEAKSGWVHVDGDAHGEEVASVGSVIGGDGPGQSGNAGNRSDWLDAMTRLHTLEAKVEIQLERSKSQGVIFHKVAFSSELEFMHWYLKENTTGKGLAAFVDLVSVWSFASLTNETAAEWLQSLSRQKSVGLDNKVEVEFSHSMSTRYPAAFVGKAELITSTQTFKIFDKLVLWRGGGVGDGVKERLLDSLRMGVERQRVYCEDNLPAGVLRDHAIRSAEFTRDFFQAFVVHIEDEITMLTSFGLGESQVLLLMSNQLMQICDDLFEFRHAAINVANSNRSETSARYAWVTLQALSKMTEYLKMKFKHHPSITGTFVRFLTRQTAETSTSGLKAKLDVLDSAVKTLKSTVEKLPSKKDFDALHNKIDLIVSAHDLKKK